MAGFRHRHRPGRCRPEPGRASTAEGPVRGKWENMKNLERGLGLFQFVARAAIMGGILFSFNDEISTLPSNPNP